MSDAPKKVKVMAGEIEIDWPARDLFAAVALHALCDNCTAEDVVRLAKGDRVLLATMAGAAANLADSMMERRAEGGAE